MLALILRAIRVIILSRWNMSKIGRKSKIALIVVLCIVFCVGIVAGAMAGVATKAIDNQKPDEF